MKIARADRADLVRILEVQKQAYWSEAMIYDDFSIPPLRESVAELGSSFENCVLLKAEIEDLIVGSIRAERRGQTCLVGRLSVDPKFQKRGIGSGLLGAIESVFPDTNRLELFTGSLSQSNISFYTRHGYLPFRQETLSAAVTLVYMEKWIRPKQAG